MALSTYPDKTLKVAKWPVAIVALALAPATALATWDLASRIAVAPAVLIWFGLGFVSYYLGWWLIFRRRFIGSFFSTFEHELTHSVFAWLTLHKVTGLRATWSKGGEMSYTGQGNWLISIAPYWFPTLTVPLMVVMAVGGFDGSLWLPIALGGAMSYHLTSTWRETHRGQTDLHKTGFVFAWMFLPTANVFAAGFVLAFAAIGLEGALQFAGNIWTHAIALIP